ncbi:hypothetical protein [Mycobacterium sp.]|uniref:hypothetical protein n=1 Tax=Mycobacterium sp. TaxID=1785 RepID=UPI0012191BB7|nr:hypothetical protein [Mycobacterium sp.]TAM67308.1 MAG: hypothetical protein EPN51_15160 [Mycobacterium sp.]
MVPIKNEPAGHYHCDLCEAEYRILLDDGETLFIDCERWGGWIGHRQCLGSDQIARLEVRGTDIQGWCDIEVSMNHRLHNQPVRLAVAAALQHGFSQVRNNIDLFEKLVTQ